MNPTYLGDRNGNGSVFLLRPSPMLSLLHALAFGNVFKEADEKPVERRPEVDGGRPSGTTRPPRVAVLRIDLSIRWGGVLCSWIS